jgi:predicted RNase H-like HicB family nuclease
MKIVIKKEPNGMYYTEIKWVEGVYAQWESIDEVIENLWSVYEEVMKLVESELKTL